MTRWAIILFCGLVVAGPIFAEGSAHDQEAVIQALIRDLGDEKFAVRKRAGDELRKIGYDAVTALSDRGHVRPGSGL